MRACIVVIGGHLFVSIGQIRMIGRYGYFPLLRVILLGRFLLRIIYDKRLIRASVLLLIIGVKALF
jgi:hypothetical protein